jgi:hypothetical protein
MGRRSAIGTLIELLGRLHARDGATVAELARSAEITARTVRIRLGDLERSGLVERGVVDGEERWFRSSRMARHGVLLPVSTARRALQLLVRLPREGQCAHVVDELRRSLHEDASVAAESVRSPRWSASVVTALDLLQDALVDRFALRLTVRDGEERTRALLVSVRALSLEPPESVEVWEQQGGVRCVVPLAEVWSVTRAINVEYVPEAHERDGVRRPSIRHQFELDAERPFDALRAAPFVTRWRREGSRVVVDAEGSAEAVARFVLAHSPSARVTDRALGARVRALALTALSGVGEVEKGSPAASREDETR